MEKTKIIAFIFHRQFFFHSFFYLFLLPYSLPIMIERRTANKLTSIENYKYISNEQATCKQGNKITNKKKNGGNGNGEQNDTGIEKWSKTF